MFPGTTGGAESLTETYKVPVIARIPLDPRIGKLRLFSVYCSVCVCVVSPTLTVLFPLFFSSFLKTKGEAMDNGESVSRALPNSPTSTAYLDLAQRVKTLLPPTQMDE